ncbi:MAG: glycosyltransferase family 39 protein [Phormidesmis sp.]
MSTCKKGTEEMRDRLRWLLGGGLLFRGLIAYFLPPGFDEAYYFLYTQHLDWSYFDHPLAVALTTGAGVWLTGVVSPLTIRLGALGLFTGSLWLLYATGRWLFGERAGWLSCVIASLCPLFFLTFGTLTAPDNALIFFWSATLYLCAQEFFPHSPYRPTARLALIGLMVGLVCLSKYHGFLLGLALVCFCLNSSRHRCALRSGWTVLSFLLFGLCLLPVFYWNSRHGWISFQFQLSDRFAAASVGYSLTNLLGVLLAEVGFLFPTLGLPLWWISVKALFTLPRQADQRSKVQFVLWSGLPVAAGFTLLGGWTQIYPAWPAPGLWTLTLLLGQVAAHWKLPEVRRWLKGTGLAVGTLLLFVLTHITLGTLQKSGRYAITGGLISPQQDPSTALIDTQQLRRQFAQSAEFERAIATADFIVTDDLWLSGYIAMALPPSVYRVVTSFTPDPRGHAFWFNPSDWLGKDALLISLTDSQQAIAPYFQSVTPLLQLTTRRGNVTTQTFFIYRADKLIRPYRYPY